MLSLILFFLLYISSLIFSLSLLSPKRFISLSLVLFTSLLQPVFPSFSSVFIYSGRFVPVEVLLSFQPCFFLVCSTFRIFQRLLLLLYARVLLVFSADLFTLRGSRPWSSIFLKRDLCMVYGISLRRGAVRVAGLLPVIIVPRILQLVSGVSDRCIVVARRIRFLYSQLEDRHPVYTLSQRGRSKP